MKNYSLSDRQKLVLKAIIEEYVSTGEPVGSLSLINKPYLDFSSATLRNDMAYLESIGLLEKTHTSSGRVPSEEGYRYYVAYLVTRDVEVVNQFPLIDKIFDDRSLRRDQVIKKSIDLISDLTNCMTFDSQSHYDRSKVAKLDIVKISNDEALLLIITDSAKVETETIKIPEFGFEELQKVIAALDKALRGKYLKDVIYILRSQGVGEVIKQYIDYQDEIVSTFEDLFKDFEDYDMFRSGIDSIFEIPEFQDVRRIRDIVNVIEKRSLKKSLAGSRNGLSVTIGKDNEFGIDDCTVISIPYQIGDEDGGTIAVIGPKRMEYKKVIPLLEYLAKNMSKLFNE